MRHEHGEDSASIGDAIHVMIPLGKRHWRCGSNNKFSRYMFLHRCEVCANTKSRCPRNVCVYSGIIGDASPMARGCFGKDNKYRTVRGSIPERFPMFGMHRRCIGDHFSRQNVGRASRYISMQALTFFLSSCDASRWQLTSPKLRRTCSRRVAMSAIDHKLQSGVHRRYKKS